MLYWWNARRFSNNIKSIIGCIIPLYASRFPPVGRAIGMARDWRNYKAVKEFPLLKGYVDMFSDISYHNEMAGLISFLYIQGQALVDYIRIPINNSHLDPRIHLFWIQPTRSGKTIAWEHTGKVLEALGIEEAMFSTGTDAALIGSWNKYEENGEPVLELQEGLLGGKKALNFDEGSVLFETKKQHLSEVVLYLQQAMNPVGTKANTLVKHLKDGTIETESRVSFWLTTFPPQGVREVVLTKGVFQRVLLLIRPWPIERREQVSEERMNTAFRRPPDYDFSINDFEQYYRTLREACQSRVCKLADITANDWAQKSPDEKEKIAQSVMYDMFKVDKSFYALLNSHKDHMYELVRLMHPQMADVVCAFIPNLLNYTIIMATHFSLLDEYTCAESVHDWIVGGDHIEMAAEIVYELYEELVTWLESEVELESSNKAIKTRQASWKAAWDVCKITSVEGKQGDWVRKSELLSVYAKQNGGVSRNTQFLHYKDAKDMFNETSLGLSKYVQIHGEQ